MPCNENATRFDAMTSYFFVQSSLAPRLASNTFISLQYLTAPRLMYLRLVQVTPWFMRFKLTISRGTSVQTLSDFPRPRCTMVSLTMTLKSHPRVQRGLLTKRPRPCQVGHLLRYSLYKIYYFLFSHLEFHVFREHDFAARLSHRRQAEEGTLRHRCVFFFRIHIHKHTHTTHCIGTKTKSRHNCRHLSPHGRRVPCVCTLETDHIGHRPHIGSRVGT